jgi:hypothetical protein
LRYEECLQNWGNATLKEVLGDHKPENPASAANDPSVKDKTLN